MLRKLKAEDINEPVAVHVEANPVVESPNSEPLPHVGAPVVELQLLSLRRLSLQRLHPQRLNLLLR